jgi:hypothetical protein
MKTKLKRKNFIIQINSRIRIMIVSINIWLIYKVYIYVQNNLFLLISIVNRENIVIVSLNTLIILNYLIIMSFNEII